MVERSGIFGRTKAQEAAAKALLKVKDAKYQQALAADALRLRRLWVSDGGILPGITPPEKHNYIKDPGPISLTRSKNGI